MQLEDIMLSELSQVQKDKGHVVSQTWKINPKDKHIYKSKHIHTQSGTTLWNSGKEEKEKRMMVYQNIIKHNICEGRGYMDVYQKLLKKWQEGGKRLRESNRGG
jgi:hypothetical protein